LRVIGPQEIATLATLDTLYTLQRDKVTNELQYFAPPLSRAGEVKMNLTKQNVYVEQFSNLLLLLLNQYQSINKFLGWPK